MIALLEQLHGVLIIGAAVIFKNRSDTVIRFLQIPDNFVQAYLIQVLHHRQPQLFLEKLGQIVGIVAEMRCNILHHDL